MSDREPIFLCFFWEALFEVLGVDMLMPTTYHPQIDGQTKVLNRCLQNYL